MPTSKHPNDTWVEVEVLKGAVVSSYRGRMASAQLEAWRKGDLTTGAMELNDTYWRSDDEDGNESWVVVGATPGAYASAVGTMYMRAENVLVILVLRDGNERELFRLSPVGASRDDD